MNLRNATPVAYLNRPAVLQILSHVWRLRPCRCGRPDCGGVEVYPLSEALGGMVALGLGRWGEA